MREFEGQLKCPAPAGYPPQSAVGRMQSQCMMAGRLSRRCLAWLLLLLTSVRPFRPQWQPVTTRKRSSRDWRPQLPQHLAAQQQSELFRHRFLVATDMVIRLPLDAGSMLERFVREPHGIESGCVHSQLEVLRPQIRWCRDSERMLSLPNAGGSSIASEALALEVLERAFGARLVMTESELLYRAGSKMTDFAVPPRGPHVTALPRC